MLLTSAININSAHLEINEYLYDMKDYNDAELNELINAGKEATRELSLLKLKRQMLQIKELLVFSRSRMQLIRKRATALNLTQTDLDMIHDFIQMKDHK